MKKNLYILLIFILTIILPPKVDAAHITLNKSKTTIGVGYSETLKYTLETEVNSSNVIWISSDKSVATVINGKVTGISEGSAIITAAVGKYITTCTVIVSHDYVPVTKVTLNKSNLSMLKGTTETLIEMISPSNATNTAVTWTSSDVSVASVENGKITAKKAGTTIITVAIDKYRATCTVKVIDNIKLTKIAINKSNITMKEKETAKLSIVYTPTNATNKKITWKSSNKNIVTIDNDGKITGISEGTATITAVSNDGGHVATTKVTVEAISKKVTSISLDKKELKLMIGEKSNITHTINPSYAENKNVTWTSSDEKIATVENGMITAISKGEVEIKVTSEDGGKEAICKVIVDTPPLKSISFSNESQSIYVGSETMLSPITEPIDATIGNLAWKSSNESVATVENGLVKALSIGETTITVSTEDNKLTTSIKIIVINKPKEKLNITIEGYDLKFEPSIKSYNLEITNETQLTIKTNISNDKVIINGNKNLKDGSIITITINEESKETYIINIKKKGNYTIIFIAAISILLLINLIRIMIKNKKKLKK